MMPTEIIELYKEIIRGKDILIAEISKSKDELMKKNNQLCYSKDEIIRLKNEAIKMKDDLIEIQK